MVLSEHEPEVVVRGAVPPKEFVGTDHEAGDYVPGVFGQRVADEPAKRIEAKRSDIESPTMMSATNALPSSRMTFSAEKLTRLT